MCDQRKHAIIYEKVQTRMNEYIYAIINTHIQANMHTHVCTYNSLKVELIICWDFMYPEDGQIYFIGSKYNPFS